MSLQMFGLARLGRDPEMRSTTDGKNVLGMSLAFTVFVKREKVTTWVDASMWGKRAETVEAYLQKGGMVSVTLEDVHLEAYNKADGTPQTKLVGRVTSLDLAGSPSQREAAPPPPPPPPVRRPPPPAAKGAFDDMDDDIPFASSCPSFDMATLAQRKMKRYRGVR